MDEISIAIDWELNIIGLMIWIVPQMPSKTKSEQHKKDDKSQDSLTAVREDLNQSIYR